MADRLTWRNVDSPDFRGSMQGYALAGDQLSNALGAISRGLGGFQAEQVKGADQAVMLRALQYGDANNLQAGLRNGSLTAGVDPRNISTDALNFLAKRPTELLENDRTRLGFDVTRQAMAVTGEELSQNQYKNMRTREQDANLDGVRAVQSQIDAAMARGDTATAANLRAQGEAVFGKLTPGQNADLLANGQRLFSGQLGNRSTLFNQENAETDRKETRQAQDLTAKTLLNSLDQTTARTALLEDPNVSDRVRMAAANAVGGAGYGNLFAPVTAGVGGGTSATVGGGAGTSLSGSTPTTAQMATSAISQAVGDTPRVGTSGFAMKTGPSAVAGALTTAGLSPQVVAGFLGNFHEEGGYDGAKGDNGSAAGIAQWRGPRQENFEKVIGKPVSKATIEDQAKYVAWEMENPTHPSVGMTVAQRDEIRNAKTPEQAAELIDKYYERSDGTARARRVAAAKDAHADLRAPLEKLQADATARGANIRVSQNQADNILPGLEAARKKTNLNSLQVANELIKEGRVTGVSPRNLADYIDRAKATNRENSAVNGELVANSLVANSWVGSQQPWFGDFDVDMNKVQEQAKLLGTGQTDQAGTANRATEQLGQAVMKASSDVDAARALYDSVVKRAESLPPSRREAALKPYRDDLTAKQNLLQSANAAADRAVVQPVYPGRQEPTPVATSANVPAGMINAAANVRNQRSVAFPVVPQQAFNDSPSQPVQGFTNFPVRPQDGFIPGLLPSSIESLGRSARVPLEALGTGTRNTAEEVGRLIRRAAGG